jgi:aminomethyltransferase
MSAPDADLQRSPLHQRNLAAGAKMTPFAGWEMPVQFSGLVAEHHAVRQACGVFDISHMGQFLVAGSDAERFLNHALTNDTRRLEQGAGQYTLLLNERGGVVDDLILYRLSGREFLLVVNAARIAEDARHLKTLAQQPLPGDDAPPQIEFADISESTAGLAIQGPKSRAVFARLFPDAAYPERNTVWMRFAETGFMWLCGTGYTGEEGFEFFLPAAQAGEWYDAVLAAVAAEGGLPCGLGARDTLRLEMGYPLNGSDLSPDHTPLEAGLGIFVALDKVAFVGREVLLAQKSAGLTRRLAAFRMTGASPPPRPHYPVAAPGAEVIGEVTSGTQSPSLGAGIGMAYLPVEYSKPGASIEIEIRGRRHPAEVCRKPFYRPQDKATSHTPPAP